MAIDPTGKVPLTGRLHLRPFGAVELQYAGLAHPDEPSRDSITFGLFQGGRSGRISLSAPLARQLLAAALGSSDPPSLRRLSKGERGLLGGFLTAILDELGVEVSVSLSPAAIASISRIAVEVVTGAASGRVVLEVPPEWIEVTSSHAVAFLDLAQTSVLGAELATLGEGDTVVFDGVMALDLAADVRWSATLTIGDHVARVSVSADGAVLVDAPFRPTKTLGPQPATSAGDRAEIVAELARTPLRRAQVVGLGPGAIVAMGARTSMVRLRVGTETWAEGELADVGGELGVRVTTLQRPPAARLS